MRAMLIVISILTTSQAHAIGTFRLQGPWQARPSESVDPDGPIRGRESLLGARQSKKPYSRVGEDHE